MTGSVLDVTKAGSEIERATIQLLRYDGKDCVPLRLGTTSGGRLYPSRSLPT
jgi:hypothetical protein